MDWPRSRKLRPLRKNAGGNKYALNKFHKEVNRLKRTIDTWDDFFAPGENNEEARANGWVRLEVVGGALTEQYAWAVPDEFSLQVISKFSPIVEVAAGKGYWASLLRSRGVDIIAMDKYVSSFDHTWTEIQSGGPKDLQKGDLSSRTLFLCYPDQTTNVASKCLKFFKGDLLIHVGELITTGTISGYPQAPFGRTTGSEFQVALCESFHCILVHKLPGFPFCHDFLTVWKRTQFVAGREGDEDGAWASIPPEERLPLEAVAPCLQEIVDSLKC